MDSITLLSWELIGMVSVLLFLIYQLVKYGLDVEGGHSDGLQ